MVIWPFNCDWWLQSLSWAMWYLFFKWNPAKTYLILIQFYFDFSNRRKPGRALPQFSHDDIRCLVLEMLSTYFCTTVGQQIKFKWATPGPASVISPNFPEGPLNKNTTVIIKMNCLSLAFSFSAVLYSCFCLSLQSSSHKIKFYATKNRQHTFHV